MGRKELKNNKCMYKKYEKNKDRSGLFIIDLTPYR